MVSLQPVAWARVRPPGLRPLRRGAWYPITEDDGSDVVVIEVAEMTVPVHRDLVTIRPQPPGKWSVVARKPEDPNPTRGTAEDLGLVYAVCPNSRTRARLEGQPPALLCPLCGERFEVDWSEQC